MMVENRVRETPLMWPLIGLLLFTMAGGTALVLMLDQGDPPSASATSSRWNSPSWSSWGSV